MINEEKSVPKISPQKNKEPIIIDSPKKHVQKKLKEDSEDEIDIDEILNKKMKKYQNTGEYDIKSDINSLKNTIETIAK